MMMKATEQQAVARTSVFWDIKTYPVPSSFDARLVGPCINRYLKNLGYSGPLTIVAVGLLTDVPHDVLQKVSSTGVILYLVPMGYKGIVKAIYGWTDSNPLPANMMLISSSPSLFPQIHPKGYNIFELFPYDSPDPESLWSNFLHQGAFTKDEISSTYWTCSLCSCSDLLCQGFEDFTTHLSSQQHEQRVINHATKMDDAESDTEYNGVYRHIEAMTVAAATTVLWDIKACPVPSGCDARRVGPCIKRFLEDLGYAGPITINAFGLLTDFPNEFLLAVSSTGVVLNHTSEDIANVLDTWTYSNSPPASLMVICPYSESFAEAVAFLQQNWEYNFIEPFPYGSPYSESLWKSFLLEDSGTLEEDKSSETGEHTFWVCSVCDNIPGIGFENFTAHLSSQEHEPKMEEELKPIQPLVFWDIKSFPVPSDCEVRWVGPCIKKYLRDFGFSGPLTINAVGLLTDFRDEVLRAVSSTGDVDFNSAETGLNPPPASEVLICLICPYSEALAKVVDKAKELGHETILPFKEESSSWKYFLQVQRDLRRIRAVKRVNMTPGFAQYAMVFMAKALKISPPISLVKNMNPRCMWWTR